MSWAKFDDNYSDHPKIITVGPLGMALHVAATCYAAKYLTDGFIPKKVIGRLISFDGIAVDGNEVSNASIVALLIENGLFDNAPGGYMVHDYLKYNPSREEVLAAREENKQRQERWKEKKRVNNVSDNALQTTPPPLPTPSLINGLNNLEEEGETSTSPESLSPDTIALSVYTGVTGFMAYPGGMQKNATKLWQFARSHGGIPGAVEYLKPFYAEWGKRKSKDGRFYSKTGDGWIDWAMIGECPQAAPQPVDKPLSGRDSRRAMLKY